MCASLVDAYMPARCANCKQALTRLQVKKLSISLAAAHTTYVPTSTDIVATSTHKAAAGKPQCCLLPW